MAATKGKASGATPAQPNDNRKPIIVVDDVHVVYKIHAGGRVATPGADRGGLLTKRTKLRTVHAVKGVSFTIYEGETVGIIGSNGSGKSTLMRAIAGLIPIDQGDIYATARPSLLGVGAVLLPALTGERNILLGGMAMGFSRKHMEEASKKIAEFAGMEEFIDLPMRTYSSGMSARLRFAIAAHRNHEILIIDEALAVGDAQFRARSEARVREMREQAGTVFLVSHSMTSILDTCNRVIWLEKGVLRADGDPQTVIDEYKAHMDANP
ncbi:teichoic acid transport system ATP-binding protein [Microbacteriaceae bacterium MWH-Ta3]|nr:teichoic acid transport system ATP-binding protein [Microbacteriaceae bacterium MWH-Ta3]